MRQDYKWRTKNIDPLYKDLLNARDLEKSINKETKSIDPIYTNLSKEIQEELEEKKKQASSIAKQLPLMVDLDNKKEVNSATVAGVPVNNSKKDKTPTQVETLLNRIASWRKKNDLGEIYHSEIFGKRDIKYPYLEENAISTIKWKKLDNKEPYFFFVPKDFKSVESYEKGFKLNDFFELNENPLFSSDS